MKRIRNCFRWIAAGLILGLSAPTQAQDWIGMSPMDYANQTTSWTNTLIMNNVIENQVRDRSGKTNTSRNPTVRSKTTRTAVPTAYGYSVTPAYQASIRDQYLARVAKKNPQLAARLKTQLYQSSYDGIYAGLLSGTGLSNNNLADVMTSFTVMGWMIVNNQQTDPPLAQIAGVRQQWANALASTKAAGDVAARRQTAEEMKLRTVLLNSGWKDAVKAGATTDFAQIVSNTLRTEFKLDMARTNLTNAGFQTR
ncbi:MAG: hypothetical protein EOP52_04725 [Sphingobacteriales bacterium]|nr:MAG: hypothetical protein EOP52_04725 [Sphingobacteriales bacterium]